MYHGWGELEVSWVGCVHRCEGTEAGWRLSAELLAALPSQEQRRQGGSDQQGQRGAQGRRGAGDGQRLGGRGGGGLVSGGRLGAGGQGRLGGGHKAQLAADGASGVLLRVDVDVPSDREAVGGRRRARRVRVLPSHRFQRESQRSTHGSSSNSRGSSSPCPTCSAGRPRWPCRAGKQERQCIHKLTGCRRSHSAAPPQTPRQSCPSDPCR